MSQTFILHANDPGRGRVLQNALAFIAALPEKQPWELTIKRHVRARSEKQRRALFGAAYKAMMDFMGLQGSREKEQLHWFMCGEYFGWQKTPFGSRKPVRTTTKDEHGRDDEISVDEALNFYAFLQRRGIEVGCYVPDPDPFWRETHRAAA